MTQELDRLAYLLAITNETCSVQHQIARTYAAGGQYREALDWLQKVVDRNCGFDPSREPLFKPLTESKEFQLLDESARRGTAAVSHSYAVTILHETDLFPENIAYDPFTSTFFIGSTSKNEIVRCDTGGTCKPFVSPRQGGLGDVLGLKIDARSKALWATSNTDDGASLREYSLVNGDSIANYRLAGVHLFNDLVVSSHGDVFVTDTKEGAVYKLSSDTGKLRRFAPQHVFTAANGIAISNDEKRLFVSNFGDGITVVDRVSESTTPMPHPADISLGYIDGLYAMRGSLVAIQNGPMTPRIVRFSLSHDGGEITAMTIVERRNPVFDGLTTGALVADRFYYIANTQIDKKGSSKAKLNPLHVLGIKLD